MIPPLLYNSRSSRTYSPSGILPWTVPASQPASRRARQPSSRPAIQQPRPPPYSPEQPTDPSWNPLRPWIMKTNRSSSMARPFSSSLSPYRHARTKHEGFAYSGKHRESRLSKSFGVFSAFSPLAIPAKPAAANGKRNWA